VEYLPADPDVPGRPSGSHRVSRDRPARSSRLLMTVGLAVVLAGAGIAVTTGAVKTPLAGTTGAPKAATLAPGLDMSAPSANANSYALATVPASLLPHASATAAKSAKARPSATPTPSTVTSSSTTSGLLTPQPTAEYQTPSGENQKAWSEAILTALGAPLTSANIISIGYWMQNEAGSPPYGIVGANNPINVSEPCCGGVPIQDDGDGVTFLQSYPSVSQGVQAIATYLERGNYVNILAALRAGAGLNDPNLASEISLYSGGGYSTIPDAFGASQGQPLS
jgi:hypothetical protein